MFFKRIKFTSFLPNLNCKKKINGTITALLQLIVRQLLGVFHIIVLKKTIFFQLQIYLKYI